jgi:tetratricopeptide (TPR) repeat protein
MKKYAALLILLIFTCGFSWGRPATDKCEEASKLAAALATLSDREARLQTEAKILELCPDGAPGQYLKGLAAEQAGNPDKAIAAHQEALRLAPNFTPASGSLGLLLLQSGQLDDAAIELTKALKDQPNARYHRGLAQIFSEKQLYSLAIFHFQEAIKTTPADASLQNGLADIYRTMGDNAKAEEAYRRVLAVEPGNESALLGLAAALTTNKQFEQAIAELKKAEASNPHNKEIHYLLAEAYSKKGDRQNAENEYLLAGIPTTSGDDHLQEVRLGDQYFAARDFAKSIDAYKTALKANPDNPVILQKLGNAFMAAGRGDEAIAAYKETIRLKLHNEDLHHNLGVLYEKKGLLDEAVVEFRQALQYGSNPEVRRRLAEIYTGRGSFPQAIEQYQEMLKSKADDPELHLKLARVFLNSNNTAEAIASYREVIRLNPDSLDGHRELALLYKKTNQQDEAEKEYREVLRLKKDDGEIRNALTASYVKKKNYPDLITLLQESVALTPKDANNHYKLGLVYEFQKDYDNAASQYKEALALKEDHAKTLNALGRVYMKTGHIKEAKEALEKAKEVDPALEETSLLLSNIKDELSPEPRKYKKKKAKGKKGKAGKKGSSTPDKKSPAKKGGKSSKKK